jgi:hypothetical protein
VCEVPVSARSWLGRLRSESCPPPAPSAPGPGGESPPAPPAHMHTVSFTCHQRVHTCDLMSPVIPCVCMRGASDYSSERWQKQRAQCSRFRDWRRVTTSPTCAHTRTLCAHAHCEMMSAYDCEGGDAARRTLRAARMHLISISALQHIRKSD